jgi:large subunit ribosomal protein L1
MGKHGKRFRALAGLVDRDTRYQPQEAMELVKQTATAKFNETVDVHIRLNVDPRKAEQQVRSVVTLPAGTGKTLRILVFADGDGARLAQEAGADYVGTDEYIPKIMEGWTDFDVAVATPQVMGKIGRLGRVLGPRGLMPSPKGGTVVQATDIPVTIRQLRQGRVEFRVDRTSNLHIPIGKSSFTLEQLMQNWSAVIDGVVRARPATVKGQYIKTITLTTTMGPGIHVDVAGAQSAKAES